MEELSRGDTWWEDREERYVSVERNVSCREEKGLLLEKAAVEEREGEGKKSCCCRDCGRRVSCRREDSVEGGCC